MRCPPATLSVYPAPCAVGSNHRESPKTPRGRALRHVDSPTRSERSWVRVEDTHRRADGCRVHRQHGLLTPAPSIYDSAVSGDQIAVTLRMLMTPPPPPASMASMWLVPDDEFTVTV